MSGLAVWCEGKELDQSCACPYEMHFNLWTNTKPYVLDIGIKVKYVKELQNLCLYFPFKLSKDSITDLGKTITSSKLLLNTVFNEYYTKEEDAEPKQIAIRDNGATVFYVYQLDINNDIDVSNKYNGTILTIKLSDRKNLKEDQMYYFRFRCSALNLNKIVEKRTNLNLLNALLTENDFIDFRLNDWRSLNNDSLIEHVRNSRIKDYCLKKVNFFVMTNGSIEIISNTKKSERKLEKGIWENYIQFDKNQVVLAHQWQQKINTEQVPNAESIEKFNAYLKFKKQWLNCATVLGYAILIVIINLISSFLAKILLGGC